MVCVSTVSWRKLSKYSSAQPGCGPRKELTPVRKGLPLDISPDPHHQPTVQKTG